MNPPASTTKTATAPGIPGGRSHVVLALAFTLFSVTPTGAAGQFSVQPAIVELVSGDSTASTVIQVRNEGEAPLQLRFYAGDFDQDGAGNHQFMDSGTHARSCADRLRFYPDGAALEPGEVQEIRVLMEALDSTCWSMLFVESGSRAGSGLRIAQRIGVKVYGVSTREIPEGEIRLTAVEEAGSKRNVVIGFANLGGGPLRPDGEIEVRTLDGEVIAVVPVEAFSVLPGRTRETRVPLDVDLEPGTYVLVPILDFGGEYLAGGQAVLEIDEP